LVKNARNVVKFYYNPKLIQQEFAIFQCVDAIPFEEEHYHDFPHVHRSYIVKCQKQGP
jgi:hypothetical protein